MKRKIEIVHIMAFLPALQMLTSACWMMSVREESNVRTLKALFLARKVFEIKEKGRLTFLPFEIKGNFRYTLCCNLFLGVSYLIELTISEEFTEDLNNRYSVTFIRLEIRLKSAVSRFS